MRGKQSFISDQSYRIVEAKLEHGPGIYEVICLANDFDPCQRIEGVFGLDTWGETLARFPEGQFVAVTDEDAQEKVVGLAISMRTGHAPSERPRSWRSMIGDLTLKNHAPRGRWLYGVEKAVHPDYQRLGIGSALYKQQFELIGRLRLEGMYAGGMLKGFRRYRGKMSMRDYASKVMRGELFDPTVSVQMRKGFKARGIIENYAWDHEAEHTGMLIVWEAPRRVPPPVEMAQRVYS